MTEYSLFPSFVRIFYHSVFGRHTMTLPTRQWNVAIGTGGQGGYEAWDTTPRDALAMITDWVGELAGVTPDSVVYDEFVIYNMLAEDAPANVVGGGSLAVSGTDATPGWIAGTQATFTFYDTAFLPAKVVVLDAASNNLFNKVPYAAASAAQVAVFDSYALATNAWSSRAGNRPATPRNLLYTLNRKLRKQYGLT
jgi:hypothetical protein